jgi:succinate dehydrogenase / fumarate reductase flavoprotein subunit
MLEYDILIVGAGGGGLYAALETSKRKGLKVAVISKVFPTRSHTGAAQGGINAALGNVAPDSVEKHIYDTVKGSDFLADQDAVELMCTMAPKIIRELEHMGLPFSRLEDGRIAQRPFGGASFPRTCYAADKTGHVMLQTLYEQCLRKLKDYFVIFPINSSPASSVILTLYRFPTSKFSTSLSFIKISPSTSGAQSLGLTV